MHALDATPLPRATPQRSAPLPEPPPPDNLPFVDPSLADAIGFRLCHRHTHTAEGACVTVCILAKGMSAGDSAGKSMMILNGLLAKGYKVVHCWKQDVDATQVMVMVFGNA